MENLPAGEAVLSEKEGVEQARTCKPATDDSQLLCNINDTLKRKRSLGAFDDAGNKRHRQTSHTEEECCREEDENSDWDVVSFDEDDTNDFIQYAINHGPDCYPVSHVPVIEEQNDTVVPPENSEDGGGNEDDVEEEEDEDDIDMPQLGDYEFPQREFESMDQMERYFHCTLVKRQRARQQMKFIKRKNDIDLDRVDIAKANGRFEFAEQLMLAIETRRKVRDMFDMYCWAKSREILILEDRIVYGDIHLSDLEEDVMVNLDGHQ